MKASDKYRIEYGFKDEDGCEYGSLQDLIQTHILGFCGCGCPESNLLYVLGGLELIKDRENCPNHTFPKPPEWDTFWQEWEEKKLAHFKSEESYYFFMYVLDKEGFTEHGGNVSGSWLDTSGDNLLDMLREWKDTEYTPWIPT